MTVELISSTPGSFWLSFPAGVFPRIPDLRASGARFSHPDRMWRIGAEGLELLRERWPAVNFEVRTRSEVVRI